MKLIDYLVKSINNLFLKSFLLFDKFYRFKLKELNLIHIHYEI